MKRYASALLLGGAILMLSPDGARAQYNSVPIFYTPSRAPENHWTLSASGGRGLNVESGESWSVIAEIGRRISRVVDLDVGGGAFWPRNSAGAREAQPQLGALLSMRLNPGPNDLTYSLFAGGGYASFGSSASEINLPLGFAIAYYISVAKGPMPQIWATARYAGRRLDTGSESGLQSGFGISAGGNYGLSCGVGAGLAIDWSYLGSRTIGLVAVDSSNRWVAGLFLRVRRCDQSGS